MTFNCLKLQKKNKKKLVKIAKFKTILNFPMRNMEFTNILFGIHMFHLVRCQFMGEIDNFG
jgi:hypothetical protein